MKRWPLLLLSLLIAIFLAFWLRPKSETPNLPAETPLSAVQTATPTARKQVFKQLHQGPRTAVLPAGETSPACRTFWRDLMEMDLADSRYRLPRPKDCPPPPLAAAAQAAFEKDCFPKPERQLTEAERPKCQYAVFLLRANLTDSFTEKEPIDRITDGKVLIDKLFARFMRDRPAASAVADRLLELYPDYYPAAQAGVLAKFLAMLEASGGQKLSPEEESARTAAITSGIEQLKRMNPQDPQNQELEVLLASLHATDHGEQVAERAMALRQAFPDSPQAPYYLAWAAYRSGNPTKGWEWLQEAKRLAPQDPRILETEARIRQNPTFYRSQDPKVKQVFQANFSFHLHDPTQ